MSDTIKTYQDQQQKILNLLAKLDKFVQDGNEFGLKLSEEMKTKLSNAMMNVKEDKLKIALVGGFSEGKTSIAAAWLGKLDKSSMNISASESSNAVKVYDIDNDCQLIDTPGLYGYKEQENSQAEIEKYKDITKKYVSEAHIILYVMNSKNPIKESHKDDLVWLFRELNLLPRTVFILSRFDEVADVEDENDYQHFLKIKQDTVITRLNDFLDLTTEEKENLKIVAVSANPFEEGIEYWLENPEEFKKLSHIDTLQIATQLVVKNNGGLQEIASEAKKSIFNDIRLQELPKVEQKNNELIEVFEDLDQLATSKQHELANLSKEINISRQNIKESVKRFFDDIVMQVRGLGIDTASHFLDREIGEDGIRIQSNVNSIFQRETATVTMSLNHQILKFESDLNNVDTALSKLTRQGINDIVKNVKLDGSTILAARDGIKTVGKAIGVDLGKALKFKPYGAINLAKNLNNFLAVAGLALEAYDSYKQAKMQEDFQRDIKALINDLQKQEKEVLELVDSDKFIPMFFQGYLDLKKVADELQSQKSQQYERNLKFEKWKKEIDIIDAEFKVIA